MAELTRKNVETLDKQWAAKKIPTELGVQSSYRPSASSAFLVAVSDCENTPVVLRTPFWTYDLFPASNIDLGNFRCRVRFAQTRSMFNHSFPIRMFHFFSLFSIFKKLGVSYAGVLDTSNEFKIFSIMTSFFTKNRGFSATACDRKL